MSQIHRQKQFHYYKRVYNDDHHPVTMVSDFLI